MFRRGKLIDTESRLAVATGWRWEERLTVEGMTDFMGGMCENVLKLIYCDAVPLGKVTKNL